MNKFLLSIFALVLVTISIAQTQVNEHWCGSVEMMEKQLKNNPELRQYYNEMQAKLDDMGNSLSVQKTAAVNYTIPVVFHILHVNGTENISDAQVQSAVDILNRDFNLQNTDTSLVIAPLKGVIGNAKINFVLARLDPNGNCTNGINRIVDQNTLNWEGNFSDYSHVWSPTKYLNIHVVKVIESGAAGYAYYPGSLSNGSPLDGIVILSNYVGNIGTSGNTQSRALTHEVGHWLNLQHVWGNSNNPGVACGNDQVNDTPVTKGYTNCSSLLNSQICNPGISENYQNYMDYSYCSVMFTNGQCTRMNNAANSTVSSRSNLGSVTNLAATGISPVAPCAPRAVFTSNRQFICEGSTIDYTDLSTISTPTSWSWSFEGGTPSTSTSQNPTITYNTPGTYSVQLISSNSVGNSTPEIKVGYITVMASPVAAYLTESFENVSLPNSTWMLRSTSNNSIGWQPTSLAASTGIKSAYISQNSDGSSTYDLFSPTFNFSASSNIALTLKWAGAERDTTTHNSFDIFSVYFSTNCGLTWTPRLTRNVRAGSVGVNGIVNGNFQPTPSQFYQEVINVTSFANSQNVMFRIRFITEPGLSNNFYLDDINLTSITSINEVNTELTNLIVYPNPANNHFSIMFNLLTSKNVEISLHDVLGKTVKEIPWHKYEIGNHTQKIDIAGLSKGIYFVKINTEGLISTQKIVIE